MSQGTQLIQAASFPFGYKQNFHDVCIWSLPTIKYVGFISVIDFSGHGWRSNGWDFLRLGLLWAFCHPDVAMT
jgi:hypothetical protein